MIYVCILRASALAAPNMTCNTQSPSMLIVEWVRIEFPVHVSRLGGEGVNIWQNYSCIFKAVV